MYDLQNVNLSEIEIGQDPITGQTVVYQANTADMSILSSIAAILIPILTTAGLKALVEFISKGEFALRYPGGRLKFLYRLASDQLTDKKSRHTATLAVENEVY